MKKLNFYSIFTNKREMKRHKPIYKNFNYLMEMNYKYLPVVINEITKLFKEKNINFCFIGGIVLPQYGYGRTTDDIDILISKNDKDKFYNLVGIYLKPAFQGAEKMFFWNEPKIKIEIIFSGEKAGSEKGIEYIKPKQIKSIKRGIPYLSLEKLIEYKLASGLYGQIRLKDFSDIQELIQSNNLPLSYTHNFRKDLTNKYKEIWYQTK